MRAYYSEERLEMGPIGWIGEFIFKIPKVDEATRCPRFCCVLIDEARQNPGLRAIWLLAIAVASMTILAVILDAIIEVIFQGNAARR